MDQIRLNNHAIGLALAIFLGITGTSQAQVTNSTAVVPTLAIKVGEVKGAVSPMLYGLMTEEINYSYEGGIYGELIRNRTFKAKANDPAFWSFVQTGSGNGGISVDSSEPLNTNLDVSLRLDVTTASKKDRVGFANGGFWGIPMRPHTTYRASFYARGSIGFEGGVEVSIVNTNTKAVIAQGRVKKITGEWKQYEVELTTKGITASKDNEFVITTGNRGTIWFTQVSLFPPTWHKRANGNRVDIMQILADMHPKFLRFPGGNYLEGQKIETRYEWQKAVGPISERPGHWNDAWGYWSTDGLGLLEFFEWCEDLNMEPLLAVYGGYSMHQQHVATGDDLEPFVREALEEIEYVTGDVNTTWGAKRAKDGHPAPFALHYVEIGNEDQFDRSGSYDGRFAQFYDAFRDKYPGIKLIATTPVNSRRPDFVDEHFYRSQDDMEFHAHDYDNHDRTGPKIFVGEWATRMGSPTPNMSGALGDAAWMTGMERNSDLVLMSCYAPLFVNVNPGAMQWKTDLIGYNALNSYGSPAYYAQQMFSTHHGDQILATEGRNIPTRTWQPPARRRNGVEEAPSGPVTVPTLFFDATRDSGSGIIYLKVVNPSGNIQPVHMEISGADVHAKADATILKSASPTDTNSIDDPIKIVPETIKIKGVGSDFTRDFLPYSITILELKTK